MIYNKNDFDFQTVFQRYLEGSASESEMASLFDYIDRFGFPEGFDASLFDEISKSGDSEPTIEEVHIVSGVRAQLTAKIQKQAKKFLHLKWITSAAAILLIAFGGFQLFKSSYPLDPPYIAQKEKISPGGNKATITLADGTKLELDGNREGVIAQGGKITYVDGRIAITDLKVNEFVSLSTPRGGTYNIVLADGTKVWLNAQSSLRYPIAFNGPERVVELQGEAYFEVNRITSNGKPGSFKPFKVVSDKQTVTVLGTAFNVSTYPDDHLSTTTLVHGKVRIQAANDKTEIALFPGEQARLARNTFAKYQVEVDDYIDWKNELFVFKEATIEQVLRKLERWYDIQVNYKEIQGSQERFTGSISRHESLRVILDIIEEAGELKFELNGRSLTVR